MASPTYTTDLSLFTDFEGTAPTMGEFTNYTAGRGQAISTDYPIQGTKHSDTVMNATGQASCSVDYGSNISWTSGWALFSWIVWTAPGAIATQANGGLVFILGSGLSDYRGWYVGGSDFGSYPYGGWQNFAVDPEIGYSEIVGSPGTSYRYAGAGVDVTPTAVAKGSPLGIDVIRYGRGEFRVAGGDTGGYASFSGMAAWNDDSSRRWGLFQKIEGGYKYKGLMILGYGAPTEFIDQNKSIVIDNTEFVQSDFNTIEVRNTSSVIDMTAINIAALGTVSKGKWVTTDNAEQNLTSCVFADMGVFGFGSNSTLVDTTWRRCDTVTQNGADIDGCTFDKSTAAESLSADNPTLVANCTYISDGSNHAIKITSTGTYSLVGNTFTGYATSTGSTGNEVIFNDSGGAVTLNASGNSGTISYRNGSGASTTVSATVAVTISANVTLAGAEVRIYDLDTTPPEYGTELAGTESNPSANYIYSGTDGNLILIQVMKDGYEEFTQQYTMPSTNGNLNILLQADSNT